MSDFDLDAYMDRPCICGAPRHEHTHTREHGRLVVRARHIASCSGFVDMIENHLGGYASENPLLARQLERQLTRSEAATHTAQAGKRP